MSTLDRDWLIPPGYGLWLPAGTVHSEKAVRAGSVHVVRFAVEPDAVTWQEPTGLVVSPLIRELVIHLHSVPPEDPTRAHAEPLLLELLTPLRTETIDVAMPTDPRLRVIAERIIRDPADSRNLGYWAGEVHSGVRTLSRLFVAETGLTFAQWRTDVRMRAAVRYLAAGRPIGEISREVGYATPSAFTAAFRRETGYTPGGYATGPEPR